MGDAGALMLGLLMSASTMVIGGRTPPASGVTFFFFAPLLIPVFILGVPLIDAVWAFVRRTVSGQGFHTPDKNHIHHRLMRLGHGHRRTVVILWLWTALLCGLRAVAALRHAGERLHPTRRGALVDRTDDLVQPPGQPSLLPGRRGQAREGKHSTVSDSGGDHGSSTPPEQGKGPMKELPAVGAFLTMGMSAAIIVAVFVVLGLWADRSWGTAPWGLLIGIALGTVAAVVSVVKQVRRFL